MKFTLPDGQKLDLRALGDADYDRVRRMSTQSLALCPTCGNKESETDDNTYRYHEIERPCNCQLQLALYARYLLANIGTQYMKLDWEDFAGTPEADKAVRAYIKDWREYLAHGFGLTFASSLQGVGKTWAATHIGKELIKRNQKVYFLDFVEMVDAFCGDHDERQEVARRMRESTFLILDDVRSGLSERQTDLFALKFEVVIRHRTNFNLPTIATTNLTEFSFESEFPRLHSLLMPKQQWINMNGVDHRKLSETGIETIEMIARGERRPIT